jgi:hypothetical protein
VVIIGGGLMGAGIAQVWSVHLAEFRGGGAPLALHSSVN